jgi:hypothetical protein
MPKMDYQPSKPQAPRPRHSDGHQEVAATHALTTNSGVLSVLPDCTAQLTRLWEVDLLAEFVAAFASIPA